MSPEIIYPTMVKTGLFSCKSSCFMVTIAFLQYAKMRMIKMMERMPGMRKYKLIVNTLMIKMT